MVGFSPIQNSYALPSTGISSEISDTYDTTHPLFRLTNTIPPLILRNLLPLKYKDANFPPSMHGDILLQGYRVFIYGYGFEGFTDNVQ